MTGTVRRVPITGTVQPVGMDVPLRLRVDARDGLHADRAHPHDDESGRGVT